MESKASEGFGFIFLLEHAFPFLLRARALSSFFALAQLAPSPSAPQSYYVDGGAAYDITEAYPMERNAALVQRLAVSPFRSALVVVVVGSQ